MTGIKILYVEDEPFLGKIVRESLQSRGFEVMHLPDGREIMSAFRSFDPDVCVLDVMLPFANGFDLGKGLRAQAPNLPIIYLTAKTQTEDVLEGFASGGNDYLRKPFSMEELIVRIHNLLHLKTGNKQSELTDSEIRFGNFVFSQQRQDLRLGEDSRNLSYRETELLALLCRQINQTVLRKDILDAVWGNDSFFNSRNLDVYITRLRECLRADARVKIITLKGVGYRLVVEV